MATPGLIGGLSPDSLESKSVQALQKRLDALKATGRQITDRIDTKHRESELRRSQRNSSNVRRLVSISSLLGCPTLSLLLLLLTQEDERS